MRVAVDAGVLFPQAFAGRDAFGQRGGVGRGGDDVAVRVGGEAHEDQDEEQGPAVEDVAGHALGHDFAHGENPSRKRFR